jgi:hypothetical protein
LNLQSCRELQASRRKLEELERHFEKTAQAPTDNAYSRELTLRSLKQTINQLKEEIARFEAKTTPVGD